MLRILKLLLEAKASKDKASHGGLTPLMTAAAKGHAELLGHRHLMTYDMSALDI